VVLGVEITRDGTVIVDGSVVTNVDEVKRLAREAHDRDPDVRAVIRADRSASWGAVIRVMDLLKQGNITKIAFGVEATAP
jgi:biopolymer transport protein ExbD